MQNTSAKKTVKKSQSVEKPVLSLKQKVEKWALPLVFVVIASVIGWTFIDGIFLHPVK
jgi:hypothetical protein